MSITACKNTGNMNSSKSNTMSIRPMSGKINPLPRLVIDMANEQADRDLQTILDGIITEDYLRKATNTNNSNNTNNTSNTNNANNSDLTRVNRLQIRVNTAHQSLLDINTMLPSLTNLILDSSTIMSIRDLGVGLRMLVTLSLNDCG